MERKIGGRGIIADGVQRGDDSVRAEELSERGARRIVEERVDGDCEKRGQEK